MLAVRAGLIVLNAGIAGYAAHALGGYAGLGAAAFFILLALLVALDPFNPETDMSHPRFPGITVDLTGDEDGIFLLVGRVRKAMLDAGVPTAEADRFVDEAMSGDYEIALTTCRRWVNC